MSSPIRRIVDLINQEVMYTGQSKILLTQNVDYINSQNKVIKKTTRALNKLFLAHLVYNNGMKRSSCYIYKIDLIKNRMSLYFPTDKISIYIPIVDNKIVDKTIIKINNNDDYSELFIENEFISHTLPMYKLIDVDLYGKPDIFNIDNSLRVEFI